MDVVGSTNLLHSLKEKYPALLAELHAIIRETVVKHNGKVVDTAGDGFFCIFNSASEAVGSSVEIMQLISLKKWTDDSAVKLRAGIHTGEARLTESGYVGLDIHVASRIMSSGHGAQILVSETTQKILGQDEHYEYHAKYLGEYQLKDLRHSQKIFQINYSGSEINFPKLNTISAADSNIPADIVSLIGRETDIEKIKTMLLKEERLITITGPGGIGKTSLALNVCRELKNEFFNGVYCVFLSSVNDIRIVPEFIAASMHLNEKIYSNEDNLLNYLKSKSVLLLLDNYEQIKDKVSLVSNLITNCPELKLIITSRNPLKLKFEREYSLPPLSLPDKSASDNYKLISHSAAVRLFKERAEKIITGFEITEMNASAVAKICIRLDGIPLAIELACARLKIFNPRQLLQRLNDKLNLLKANEADRPERHQTLRNTILWSYELLNPKEKILFEAMSVFNGGCTFEGASKVSEGLFENEMEFLDTLQNLCEKNLLIRETDACGNVRFTMFETIKEFAEEVLSGKNDLKKQLYKKHSDYYITLSEEAEKHLTGKDLIHWLDVIESDISNIRAAIKRAEVTGDTEAALKYCASLWRFWIIRGNLSNDYKLVENILSMPYDDTLKLLRAKVLNGIGTIVHELSDYKLSYPLIEESLKIYKELNDVKGILSTLVNLSWVSVHLGELDKAEKMCSEVFVLNQKVQDNRVYALVYNNLGWLNTMKGNFAESRNSYLKSLEMRIRVEDNRGIGFVKSNIGWVDTFMGNYEESEKNIVEAIEIIQNINDKQLLGWAYTNYGFLEFSRMNLDSAEEKLNEALRLMREVYNEWGITYESLLLGMVTYFKSKNTESFKIIEKSLSNFRKAGSRWGIERALICLSILQEDKSEYINAIKNLSEALSLAEFLNDRYGYFQIFENFAYIFYKLDQSDTAELLSAAARKIRAEILTPVLKSEIHFPGLYKHTEQKSSAKILTEKKAIQLIRKNIQEKYLIIN